MSDVRVKKFKEIEIKHVCSIKRIYFPSPADRTLPTFYERILYFFSEIFSQKKNSALGKCSYIHTVFIKECHVEFYK